MSKKRWLWGIVIVVVAVGLLVTAGFIGYRIGVSHAIVLASGEEGFPMHRYEHFRFFHPGDKDFPALQKGQRGIPNNHFIPGGRAVGQFTPGFPYFFSPLSLIARLAVLGLIIWLLYKAVKGLFHGNGWQLTFQRLPENSSPPENTKAKNDTSYEEGTEVEQREK